MNSHVNNSCSNAFYYFYNISRIREYLSRRSTETLIHTYVSSCVDYCNSLIYGLLTYQLNKLQRVQNAAAMLIFQESKYCHVRPLVLNLHWLPVKFRIDFKIQGIRLSMAQRLFISRSSFILMKHVNTSYAPTGLLPNPVKVKTSTTLGDRSFAVAAPQLWNSLPHAIRSSPSVPTFKKTLKTFLFQKAFLVILLVSF